MPTLLSDANPLLKDLRRAASRGALTSEGLAVAEGFHLLEEALRSRCEIPVVIAAESAQALVATHLRGLQSAKGAARTAIPAGSSFAPHSVLREFPKSTRVVAVSDKTFAHLAATESPQGVIALVRPPTWTLDQLTLGQSKMDQLVRGKPLVVVLDGVQDPGNAGAIVRAAEAFGATGAAFLKGSVNPYNPKCLRASAGSTFRLPVASGIEHSLLSAALKQKEVVLYAALPRASRTIAQADFKGACAIVIGSEGRGITASLGKSAVAIRIPTCGVESLNAAVAAGVLLYEAQRQRAQPESPRA